MTATEVSSHVQALVDLIEQRELSDDEAAAMKDFLSDLLDAAKEGKLNDVDRDEFRSNLDLERTLPEPTITVLTGVVLPAKDVSVEQRVQDGNYNWSNTNINGERFSVTLDAGLPDLYLAHFGADVESDDVEAWATAHGYAVALVEELLAVGVHPEHGKLQLEFPIIALGSSTVVDGDVRVPSLGWGGSERELYLGYRDDGWPGDCRFLLRKVSVPSDT